ncbi:glycogen debranching protein GlgX [Quadrisphaera granulorum]|uniref:glycogen debranching protein GlgX n=1 Tax=Quadrisphaera granulorum TaxID=317664 RepID=UPI001FE39AF0|nr:glycogen debranching protein GlgX [Quadrisphaera granulorum]
MSSTSSTSSTLGVRLHETGASAAVVATHADAVDVCLLDPTPASSGAPGWVERRVPLTRRPGGLWTGELPGVRAGQRYGLRVDGPWEPAAGLRHDPSKLLLDPYALAVEGELRWGPELFAHEVDGPQWLPRDPAASQRRSGLDSAGHVPVGVVVEAPVADPASRPRTPWSSTVVYEAHLRGLTMLHPDVPPELRGTWAGLAHPAVVEHLSGLGVTAVELLPVQAIGNEVSLARRDQKNYWGYSTLSWFAPEPRYASAAARAAGPAAVLAEVRDAIAALHAAGLEVLLDVVYNHSCEGHAHDGPTLSLRGIDAAGYYRLDGGRDVDSTGCGNSLDFGRPQCVRLAMDSLRHWVTAFGVDGFRFDLAPTLGRGLDGAYRPDAPLLLAMGADPVLSDVKLISEPWDLGPNGWRTGDFPQPFAEWNDRFRDGAREFWLAVPGRASRGEPTGSGLGELALRLTGSADLFGGGPNDRGPLASMSFITAHDGFTLADACAFDYKHNHANGEDNRDGTDSNRSWNHGMEGWPGEGGTAAGPLDVIDDAHPVDPDELMISAMRRRSMRNLLATLVLSAGVPMITAGDEIGRTQGGNNNPYCLDDETSWIDWHLAPWQEDLLASTRELLGLRAAHPVLHAEQPPRSARADAVAGAPQLTWWDVEGGPMDPEDWQDPQNRTVQVYLGADQTGGDDVLLVLAGDLDDESLVLPPQPGVRGYRLLWDSAVERYPAGALGELDVVGTKVPVSALSVRLYRPYASSHDDDGDGDGEPAGQSTAPSEPTTAVR